jgi:hypothetical protein
MEMGDTIEWLETIGGDASLRYAPGSVLTGVLEPESELGALRAAVAQGDASLLRRALHASLGVQYVPHVTLGPAHEDDDPDEGEDAPPPPPPLPVLVPELPLRD